MDQFCGNTFWDLNFTWYTEDPDLTPCFQNTVLVWIPCTFLWICSSYQIYTSLHSFTKNIPWNALNIMKIAFSGLLILIQVLELAWLIVHAWDEGSIWYTADYATPAIKLLTFGLVIFLDAFNRYHGVRSSGTVFLFWLLLAVCEAVGFRAAMRQPDEHPKYKITYMYILETIYYPIILGQLLLNCWADAPPRDHGPIPLGDNPCPEHASSFLSRTCFFWFEKLARLGYRKPLEADDLWNLKPEDTCQYLNPKFQSSWSSTQEKVQQVEVNRGPLKGSYSKVNQSEPKVKKKRPQANVLLALAKVFGGTFTLASLLSVSANLIRFTTPQILNMLIGHVSEGSSEETWKGYSYAVLLFLASAISTLLFNQCNYNLFTMGMNLRTTVVSAIYQKTVRISSAAREESTAGEIVNLMSVDAQRLADLCMYMDLVWSAPIDIGLSLYLLWQILGPSVLGGMIIMLLMQPMNAYMTSLQNKYHTELMKLKDKRIKLMNEILAGIKVLKLYAWEPSFEEQIMAIRAQEVKVLRKAAFLLASNVCVWACAPFFVSAVTFGTYVLVDEHNVLDAQKAFVSLSLFNLMRVGVNMLPVLLVFFVQARVSIKRINKYLNADEVQDDAVNHDPKEVDQVSVKDGHFSWKKDTPVLRNINFSVKEGQLVAVVGTVGVGKSTLLSALLGEVDHKSGHVHTNGRIAYVAQQAWIQNATLRDNVLFGLPLEHVKYQKVLDGCALRPDLEILPAGDETEIGEKGINLSGGQKQRVALARATYNSADLYLLDDPLSAVDSHVAKHLFDEVIGPTGILKHKTRVLVTHGITFLPQMDNIIVISDGEISEQGTYQELLAKKGAFADFLIHHLANDESGRTHEDEAAVAIISDLQQALGSEEEFIQRKARMSSAGSGDDTTRKYQRQFSKQMSNMSTTSVFSEGGGDSSATPTPSSPTRRRHNSDRKESQSQVSLNRSKSEKDGQAKGKANGHGGKDRLIEAEGAEIGRVKLSVVLTYIRAVGIAMASCAMLMQMLTHSFLASSNFWLSVWADDNEKLLKNGNQTQDAGETGMYLSVYVALGVGQAVTKFVAVILMAFGCLHAATVLHNQMLHRILRAPMWFFDTTPTGRIVNRFGKDIDSADNSLPNAMSFALNCIFQVLVTLIVICYVTPLFILIMIPVTVFYFFAQRFYVATVRQLRRLESTTRSPIFSHFGETLTGTTTIRAFGAQDRFVADLETKVDQNQAPNFATIVANRFLGVTLEMSGNLIILCAALLAVWSRGSLSAGLVGLSVTYALQITQTLNYLVRSISDVETNLVSVERLKEYGEVVQEAEYENKNTKPPKTWPDSGEVAFEKYQTRYREGLDLVLHDVTCKIQPGEKVGIVGRTGAGKSSLTLSLFRIIEAAGGAIKIDGVDIAKLGLHDVRRKLTIIPQDPIIFSGPLRLNLDPFNEHTDEQLWRSLELAHLKPFVKGLDGGLGYELTEGGENLSVGQRQLVCLARALLRKSKILVLDEATAAIDLETDDLIQDTIRKEFADCTILTIAHRLNTIMDYGRVMVLDHGSVKEFDTPEKLLRDKNSIFYGMAKDAGLV